MNQADIRPESVRFQVDYQQAAEVRWPFPPWPLLQLRVGRWRVEEYGVESSDSITKRPAAVFTGATGPPATVFRVSQWIQ
jgi:hypothetical protein